MAKKQERHAFTIEVDGETHECERFVFGTRVLNQHVSVKGIGTEPDSAAYGPNGHPVISMPGAAKLLARMMVLKHRGTVHAD